MADLTDFIFRDNSDDITIRIQDIGGGLRPWRAQVQQGGLTWCRSDLPGVPTVFRARNREKLLRKAGGFALSKVRSEHSNIKIVVEEDSNA